MLAVTIIKGDQTMPMFIHRKSDARVEGVQLAPNTTLEEGDVYDSATGKWETNPVMVGGRVPAGDHVTWVRPARAKARKVA